MLSAQNLSYAHPDRELLFKNICFSVNKQDKIALIGNNGTGKSTLLKIIAGILKPSEGSVQYLSTPYYVPQHFGQFNTLTIAEALHVDAKLKAFYEIQSGVISEENWSFLNDDWTIEDRCHEAISYWKLQNVELSHTLESLSGGQKTKVFLAGILIHDPEIVLLDEPTNHLDTQSREVLYDYILKSDKTMVVVSHDRALLELLNPTFELNKHGMTAYGGNYSFYRKQKAIEENAIIREIENKQNALKAAKRVEIETIERKQRQNARGKKKLEKENVPSIIKKTVKNRAEATTANLMKTHAEKKESISEQLKQCRDKLSDILKIKMDFSDSSLHTGKILINAQEINFKYNDRLLWNKPLSFQITSGERINVKGANGAGKSTLLKIISGDLQPVSGVLNRSDFKSVYIDQDYSLIRDEFTVYAQAQLYNRDLQEHEIKIRLNRYLFDKEFFDRSCSTLSGGEKMRLTLCCLMICADSPDLFILDEPTNNLDIHNTEILASAIKEYKGTLIVVSHDIHFLAEIEVERTIEIV